MNIANQREASVLRDDVKKLCSDAIDLFLKKKQYLSKLEKNCRKCNSYIRADDYESVSDIIEEDQYLIETIDTIDYEISQILTSLASKYSISLPALDEFLKSNYDEEYFFKRITDEKREIIERITKLSNEKSKIILEINNGMCKTKKDMKQLNNLRKLYSSYPELAEL